MYESAGQVVARAATINHQAAEKIMALALSYSEADNWKELVPVLLLTIAIIFVIISWKVWAVRFRLGSKL
jgi:hypothetical protein